VGLVHSVSNVIEGVFYVCNCCGCCCGVLRGITEYGIEHSIARANYYAVIEEDECANCGICVARCQVNAISEKSEMAIVDRARCIGCGLCVSGCPVGAVRLEKRHGAEIVHPPENFEAWEHERMKSREHDTH
jgi:electron transport complex protein RnfB